MPEALQALRNRALACLLPAEEALLLANVRVLEEAARNGGSATLLRDKNLGLLCDDDSSSAARLFQRAASSLGARVAHLRPSLGAASSDREVRDTAQMLGRLYDAIECQGLPPELVARIGAAAQVPVYDGIALPGHPTTRLVERLDAGGVADARSTLLQAVLLGTLV